MVAIYSFQNFVFGSEGLQRTITYNRTEKVNSFQNQLKNIKAEPEKPYE